MTVLIVSTDISPKNKIFSLIRVSDCDCVCVCVYVCVCVCMCVKETCEQSLRYNNILLLHNNIVPIYYHDCTPTINTYRLAYPPAIHVHTQTQLPFIIRNLYPMHLDSLHLLTLLPLPVQQVTRCQSLLL